MDAGEAVDPVLPVVLQESAHARPAPDYRCYCGRTHGLTYCRQFRELPPDRRLREVIALGRCTNCFAQSHSISTCNSDYRCRECGDKHHTLLHSERETVRFERPGPSRPSRPQGRHHQRSPTRGSRKQRTSRPYSPQRQRTQANARRAGLELTSAYARHSMMPLSATQHLVLQPTVQCVIICGSRKINIRALVDICAATSSISIDVLRSERIGRNIGDCVDITLSSRIDAHVRVTVSASVVEKIPLRTPVSCVPQEHVERVQCYKLADESFGVPGSVQMILNSEFYAKVVLPRNHISVGLGLPTIMETKFGCLLTGSF